MLKRTDICVLLLLAVIGCASTWARAEEAPAPNVDQAKVEELTDLVVQALPLDKLVRHEKEADPKWPFQEAANRVSAEQLQCMRDQYLPKDYREMKRQDVIAFMNRYPGEADDALRILNGGVAETFAKFFLNGTMDEKAEIDAKMSLIHNNPTLLLAVLAVESDYKDKYQHLRELIGFSGNPMLAGAGIHQDIRLVMSKLRLRAMSECKIPMSAWAQAEEAPAPNIDQAKVERFTDLVVRTLPLGELSQRELDADPKYPLQGKSDRVTLEQLQCLRSKFSAKSYREMKRQEVIGFMRRYPGEVDESVRVLNDGVAEIFSLGYQDVLNEKRSGVQRDSEEVMSQFTPAQKSMMTAVVSDAKYRNLRELIGFGGNSLFDREQSSRGMTISVGRWMLRAVDACKIPRAVLLD